MGSTLGKFFVNRVVCDILGFQIAAHYAESPRVGVSTEMPPFLAFHSPFEI